MSERQGNILDPIHSTLDVRVFEDPAAPEPHLREHLQHWLSHTIFEALDRHGYDHPDSWLTLVLTGSLTTYQYSDKSDVDVSLFVDAKKLPEWSRAEMIGIMVSDFDAVDLPGTPFPLQAYVVASGIKPQDLYKPGLRSGYVVWGPRVGTWIVPPERERVHDVEHEMDGAYTAGLLACDKLDLLLRYEPEHAVEYWHQLHKSRMEDETAGKGDYATSNIIFKMLTNRGLAQQAAKLAGEHLSHTAAWGLTEDELVPEQAAAMKRPHHEQLPFAKNPVPGTRLWRGELRDPDSLDSVGMHWSTDPGAIINHQGDLGGKQRVVWQATLDNPKAQAYSRDHPMWGGKHRSMNWEGEVRLRPNTNVSVEGYWTPNKENPGQFYPYDLPDRTVEKRGWKFNQVGQSMPVRMDDSGYVDYSDVGISNEIPTSEQMWDQYERSRQPSAFTQKMERFPYDNQLAEEGNPWGIGEGERKGESLWDDPA